MALAAASPALSVNTIVSINPTSIAANTVATETFTVKGLNPDSTVNVSCAGLNAGYVLIGQRCTAADVLELTFWNVTGAAIDPAASNFIIQQL